MTFEAAGRNKRNQAHVALNKAKWSAAHAYCKQNNIRFRIVSEKDLFHHGRRG